MTLITTRRVKRSVWSWAAGTHMPDPYRAEDGRWRCRTCLRRLRPYITTYNERRLRHYWRDRP